MSSRGYAGDLSAVLYLVPFAVPGIYGLYLWVQSGISPILPPTVYLMVTRDPIVFAIGSLAVMLGMMLEVNGTEQTARTAKLASVGNTLQSMAVAALILVLISAWYANGFTDISGMATDFIVGRYGLVFPTILVLLSYLITAQFRFSSLGNRKVLAVIALLLVPASLYEIGKRELVAGLALAFVFLLIGLALYFLPERKTGSGQQ
jgi:hypothetical protein